MLLALDIGNTNISCGVFEGETLWAEWKLPTDPTREWEEYAQDLLSALNGQGVRGVEITGVILGTVVRGMAEIMSAVCADLFNRGPVVATPRMVPLAVAPERPEGVGIDRLLSAAAAYHRFGGPLVVVDVGTAITVDVVSADGVFLGGAIAPGLRAALAALSLKTSLLPHVELRPPEALIGTDTPGCIRSGVIYGSAGLIDGLVRRMAAQIGLEAPVVGTGGDIDLVAPYSETIRQVDRHLVLRGLRMAYKGLQG